MYPEIVLQAQPRFAPALAPTFDIVLLRLVSSRLAEEPPSPSAQVPDFRVLVVFVF